MLGTLHVIPSSSSGRAGSLHRIIQMEMPPTVERLIKAVGGPVKLIPGFDSILRGGEVEPCLAFCCERDDPSQNTWANLLWLQALVRTEGFASAHTPGAITGPVALLWGDISFLKSLDPLLAFLSQEEHS